MMGMDAVERVKKEKREEKEQPRRFTVFIDYKMFPPISCNFREKKKERGRAGCVILCRKLLTPLAARLRFTVSQKTELDTLDIEKQRSRQISHLLSYFIYPASRK